MKRWMLIPLATLAAGCATAVSTDHVLRVSPRDAHRRVEQGEALLVCAYREEDCRGTHLAGAITLEDLEGRLPGLRPGQQILFFCGCPHEASAAFRAAQFEVRGFTNVGVVAGGILEWILEGYEVTSTGKGGVTWVR